MKSGNKYVRIYHTIFSISIKILKIKIFKISKWGEKATRIPNNCLKVPLTILALIELIHFPHGSWLSGYNTCFPFGQEFSFMWRVFQSTSALSQSSILIRGFRLTNLAVQSLTWLKGWKISLDILPAEYGKKSASGLDMVITIKSLFIQIGWIFIFLSDCWQPGRHSLRHLNKTMLNMHWCWICSQAECWWNHRAIVHRSSFIMSKEFSLTSPGKCCH